MIIWKRAPLVFIAAPLMAVAVSCVESRHPLSDEKNSIMDERLIGTWRIEDDLAIWQVKRSGDTKKALAVTIDDKSGNGTGRAILFTTTIKSKGYVSIKELDEDAPKKPQADRYDIYQYVFLNNYTVQFRCMELTAISKAISDKKLGGKLGVTKTDAKPVFKLSEKAKDIQEETPIITDSPEGIARYIEAHADECFPAKTECSLTFKRQQ
jgi:hypothetical protein